MSRGQQSNSTQKEVKKIKISLEDLYKGKNITFKITRTVNKTKKNNIKRVLIAMVPVLKL